MLRNILVVALPLSSCIACMSRTEATPVLQPMEFDFVARLATADGQWLDATVAPQGRTVPTTFRLWLSPPGLTSKARDTIRAILRRGDPAGAEWLPVMLGGAFYPPPASPVSSDALTFIDLSSSIADSLVLVLSVRSPLSTPRWIADARLANGGQFRIILDKGAGRGSLRAPSDTGDIRVYKAISGLFAKP